MKPFSEYLCKRPPLPQKSKYTIVYIYDKGAVLYKGCPESEIFQSYMSDRSSGVHQYDFDENKCTYFVLSIILTLMICC